MKTAMRWGLAVVAVAWAAGEARTAAAGWHETQCAYRKVIKLTATSLQDPLAAVIGQGLALNFTVPMKKRVDGNIDASLLKVYFDGHVRPDGADVRVRQVGGKAVPHKVIYCDPTRYALVMHQVPNPRASYYVYYGDPKATPSKEAGWEPKRGLFMKTSEAPPGMARDLPQMKALHGKTPQVYGMQYNLWIFNHYNPMGPVEHYLCYYRGYLNCPETGMYEFGTTSDGPSFFVLDGKVVAQQTSGRASREITHTTKIRLTKGCYPVEYWGGGPEGPYRVAAAWKRPGDAKIDIIRYEYFPKCYTSEVTATAKNRGRVACDFDQQMLDSMPLDTGQINSYQFTNKTTHTAGARVPMKFEWDFGDGATSTERDPMHVFFKVGEYTIKLTARDATGASDTIERTVMIEDYNTVDHERQHAIGALIKGAIHLEHHHSRLYLQIPPEEVEKLGRKFMTVVDRYDPARVVSVALWGMVRLYHRMREHDKVVVCTEAFLDRFSRENPSLSATCRMFVGDVTMWERNKPSQASKYYEAVIQSAGATLVQQKIARIRLADILLGQDKRDEAVKQLQRAEKIKDPDVVYKAPEFRINAYDTQLEDCVNRKMIVEGLDVVARWERNFPMELMRGRLLLLRGRLRVAEKRLEQGVADFRKAPLANPHSPDLPEAYYRLGETLMLLKRNREAQDAFRKVVAEFPRSPFYSFAKAGLFKAKGGM